MIEYISVLIIAFLVSVALVGAFNRLNDTNTPITPKNVAVFVVLVIFWVFVWGCIAFIREPLLSEYTQEQIYMVDGPTSIIGVLLTMYLLNGK